MVIANNNSADAKQRRKAASKNRVTATLKCDYEQADTVGFLKATVK
jgi:hypothetical protein